MSLSSSRHSGDRIRLPKPIDLSEELGKYIGRQVSYATHGIHRYPAKFIPQIPRFCLDSFSRVGDTVLDPFMGSGTTLLESYILGRNCYGVDIHPLARMIAKVKTTPIDPVHLNSLASHLFARIRADDSDNSEWIPEIPNRDHWFRPEVLADLATIKKHVWRMRKGDYQDFFKICFSSIIRKMSNSDADSLIPEVTTFRKKLDEQGKTSFDAIGRFENTVRNKLIDAEELWRMSEDVKEDYWSVPFTKIIGKDARDIRLDDSEVDLAISSPPYASAVHYVSVHKLEMFWLGLLDDIAKLDGQVVGTSRAYVEEYRPWEPKTAIPELRSVLHELVEKEKKSAYIVYKYFDDMRRNFAEVNRVLKRSGKYCMVVGENTFRKVRIPTYSILARIAVRSGFEVKAVYSYDIINRHLDVPRWNNSRIEKDYILVLQRKRVPDHDCL
ncbi:TPA: site-specific DNA-methyltransferase [Thermoplasmata archaeon]|nr:site-specific DNA-methyltransferase [Thermoplasmata archaeon]